MHKPCSYDYAVIRVVPRIERGEFINAGVILFCPKLHFLSALVRFDENRLLALSPDVDLQGVRISINQFPEICRASTSARTFEPMTLQERFRWLVAPRSASIQISDVYSGFCDRPDKKIQTLFEQMVA